MCLGENVVRKASGTRITLVRKRCAWGLRLKLKPHSELPCAEGDEFMEVLALDRGAGVRLVQEGSSSCMQWTCGARRRQGGSAREKLVASSSPTAADREEHIAMHQHRAMRSGLGVAECIVIVQLKENPRFRRLPLTMDT